MIQNWNAQQNTSMKPRKVLVVDDDPVIRDMMVDILEAEGYSIAVARNGLEALRLLRDESVSGGGSSGDDHERYLVFLDVMMPQMDGKEVCKCLAAQPAIRQRHAIILMSALDRLDEVEEWTSCKVEGIIPKPFVVEDVLRTIERYITPA